MVATQENRSWSQGTNSQRGKCLAVRNCTKQNTGDGPKAEEELHNCHVPGHNDAYLLANVNRKKHYCLLDIGSAITLIP